MEEKIRELLVKHSTERAKCDAGYYFCPECGYEYGVFPPEAVQDPEDEWLHMASVIAGLVTEYQAKAWDKGYDKGSSAYSGIKRLYAPPGPTKGNKNPYRHQETK